ncbi:MAG: energy-coupling factor ABC transporter ATP-binding protein [Chloroflexi bacterium]|nr:energy-coupling factor ABC transporter ATP-binding protein [Chloroflexota bacterium]
MNIEIEQLHFAYPSGPEVLHGVHLTIAESSCVAIVGANGSGKTTLVRHFNGLLRPTSGVVRVGDWRTSDHSISKLASRVGYVFQNPDEQLFKSSVRQELAFGPTNLHMSPQQVEQRIKYALELFGLEDKAEVHPADLSFPLRKLVTFASVVAMDTPILVLDEPTTGQDARTVRLISQVIDRLHQEHGKTIVAISHDMEFVAEHFERVVVMDQGQILLDGTPQEVFSQEEILQQTSVYPPQLTRLAHRLGIKQVVCTPEDFIQALSATKSARSS